MQEYISPEGCTILVRGLLYYIPWEVLEADPIISDVLDIYQVADERPGQQLYKWITLQLDNDLYIIRSHVALYQEKYAEYLLSSKPRDYEKEYNNLLNLVRVYLATNEESQKERSKKAELRQQLENECYKIENRIL